MFTLIRWLLGPLATLGLIGYLVYQNTYNTPEARIQRHLTSGIESAQRAIGKYTGVKLPEQKTFIEKSTAAITKGWNSVVSEVQKQAPGLKKQAQSVQKEATKTYNKATGSSTTNVTRYKHRTTNNEQ